MKLLIAHADRHRSTQEIAETLGAQIHTELLNHAVACGVDVLDVDDVETLRKHDAVVLGSAMHFGRRFAPMRRFVAANTEALTTRPLWVFDSGLPVAETDPVDLY